MGWLFTWFPFLDEGRAVLAALKLCWRHGVFKFFCFVCRSSFCPVMAHYLPGLKQRENMSGRGEGVVKTWGNGYSGGMVGDLVTVYLLSRKEKNKNSAVYFSFCAPLRCLQTVTILSN